MLQARATLFVLKLSGRLTTPRSATTKSESKKLMPFPVMQLFMPIVFSSDQLQRTTRLSPRLSLQRFSSLRPNFVDTAKILPTSQQNSRGRSGQALKLALSLYVQFADADRRELISPTRRSRAHSVLRSDRLARYLSRSR
jgi:hypothetical protein